MGPDYELGVLLHASQILIRLLLEAALCKGS